MHHDCWHDPFHASVSEAYTYVVARQVASSEVETHADDVPSSVGSSRASATKSKGKKLKKRKAYLAKVEETRKQEGLPWQPAVSPEEHRARRGP